MGHRGHFAHNALGHKCVSRRSTTGFTARPITGSGGYPTLRINTKDSNYNIAVNWAHTFGSTSVLELAFGRVSAENDRTPNFTNIPSDFFQNSGFASYFYNHGKFGGLRVPSVQVGENYISGTNYVGKLHYSNIWEYRGDYSKTVGRHNLRTGASLATYGWEQPFYGSEADFAQAETQDANFDANTGDAMASFVLGVPDYAEVDNVYSLLHGGKVIGGYFQDQWRVTDKLTINWGLRYDLTVNPREGKASNGSNITGDFNFSNGTYILQNSAPACSPTQGAPCIPGGTLPANVTVAESQVIPTPVHVASQLAPSAPRYQQTPSMKRPPFGHGLHAHALSTENPVAVHVVATLVHLALATPGKSEHPTPVLQVASPLYGSATDSAVRTAAQLAAVPTLPA